MNICALGKSKFYNQLMFWAYLFQTVENVSVVFLLQQKNVNKHAKTFIKWHFCLHWSGKCWKAVVKWHFSYIVCFGENGTIMDTKFIESWWHPWLRCILLQGQANTNGGYGRVENVSISLLSHENNVNLEINTLFISPTYFIECCVIPYATLDVSSLR